MKESLFEISYTTIIIFASRIYIGIKDLKREDAIFVLVGNKIDLEEKRAVSNKEASEFASEKGFLFHEVSAKTGDEIQELFNSIIFPEMARKFNIGDEEEEGKNEHEEGDKKVKLNQNDDETKKKGGCCGGGKNKTKKMEQKVADSDDGN